jgi:hypothetical protein
MALGWEQAAVSITSINTGNPIAERWYRGQEGRTGFTTLETPILYAVSNGTFSNV